MWWKNTSRFTVLMLLLTPPKETVTAELSFHLFLTLLSVAASLTHSQSCFFVFFLFLRISAHLSSLLSNWHHMWRTETVYWPLHSLVRPTNSTVHDLVLRCFLRVSKGFIPPPSPPSFCLPLCFVWIHVHFDWLGGSAADWLACAAHDIINTRLRFHHRVDEWDWRMSCMSISQPCSMNGAESIWRRGYSGARQTEQSGTVQSFEKKASLSS